VSGLGRVLIRFVTTQHVNKGDTVNLVIPFIAQGNPLEFVAERSL
jgi:hypothetical protein